MGAIRAEASQLAVKAIVEGQVGVQPGTVGATIVLAHVECIFEVVEIAQLHVAIDLVKLLQLQDHVLDLWAAYRSIRIGSLPATTVSPTTASSGPLPLPPPQPTVSLDDNAQNVEADHGIGPDLLEGKPPVFCDSMRACTSKKNGSALRPAKMRRPSLSHPSPRERGSVSSHPTASHTRPSCTGATPLRLAAEPRSGD